MRTEQRGAVTPLALGGLAVGGLSTMLVSVIGGALVTQRQAQSAADLAALAGAVALQHRSDGCAAAGRSAAANAARLTACTVDGQVVTVRVARLAPRLLGRSLTVDARARAGPR